MSEIGKKFDGGKARWDLLPFKAVSSVVEVLGFGAKKYGDENWRKVENGGDRYFAAALRHLVAHRRGEKIDSDSGLPHLAHAVCCVLFLMEWAPAPVDEKSS